MPSHQQQQQQQRDGRMVINVYRMPYLFFALQAINLLFILGTVYSDYEAGKAGYHLNGGLHWIAAPWRYFDCFCSKANARHR